MKKALALVLFVFSFSSGEIQKLYSCDHEYKTLPEEMLEEIQKWPVEQGDLNELCVQGLFYAVCNYIFEDTFSTRRQKIDEMKGILLVFQQYQQYLYEEIPISAFDYDEWIKFFKIKDSLVRLYDFTEREKNLFNTIFNEIDSLFEDEEVYEMGIHKCAMNDDFLNSLIEFIGGKNVPVDISDKYGCTPLMFAVKFNAYETVTYLLEHGANPNAIADNGMTPLAFAVENKDKRMIDILFDYGADIEKIFSGHCILFGFSEDDLINFFKKTQVQEYSLQELQNYDENFHGSIYREDLGGVCRKAFGSFLSPNRKNYYIQGKFNLSYFLYTIKGDDIY